MAGKSLRKTKVFPEKDYYQKKLAKPSLNAKSKGYSRILQVLQGAQDPQDQQRRTHSHRTVLLPALMRSKSLMKERRIYWSASKSGAIETKLILA
jgi:hypothetical protein